MIILPAVLGVLYFSGQYVYYGSLTRSCIYTSNKISVPEEIAGGEIIVARDSYVATGVDEEYSCLKNFRNIDNEIVGPENINNPTISRRYYIDKGLSLKKLIKGTSFKVVAIISVTKHGISTIDSGPGPIYFLILKDNSGVLYKIATVSFGFNKEDLFLAFINNKETAGSSLGLLNYESFDEKRNSKTGNYLEYTGILTKVSEKYLKGTESRLKKLADRIEAGEKIKIMINLEMIGDGLKKTEFPSNKEKRYQQVAIMENEFLNKIPNDIVLNNIRKDKNWPNISVDANLNLLNYIFDNKVKLKIKTISELN